MINKQDLFDIFTDIIETNGGDVDRHSLVDNRQIESLFNELEDELYETYGDGYDTVFGEMVDAILDEFDLDGAIHEARSNAYEQHERTTNPERYYGYPSR